MEELDPNWDWIDVTTLGGKTRYVKGRCTHLRTVPVDTVKGEIVAQLCVNCDAQLPPPAPEDEEKCTNP